MMVHKGKRATITQRGLELIIRRSLDHPRMPRTKLAEQLQGELEAMGQDVPEVEVLERKISWWRNHATDDPQDKPWSMSTLDEYPISPETLPKIFLLSQAFGPTSMDTVTIRDAKWMARLAGFMHIDANSPLSKEGQEKTYGLYFIAQNYSKAEQLAEWLKIDLDTTELDEELFRYRIGEMDIYKIGNVGVSDTFLWMKFQRWKEAQNERSHTSEG